MGANIHYRGRAANCADVEHIMNTAVMFAAEQEWMFAIFDDPMGIMEDLDKDDPGYLEHEGPIRGTVIKAHRDCEAMRLVFNVRHELEGSTKTQSAPFEVHAQLVELLRILTPRFAELEVVDETGLWETGDVTRAKDVFTAVDPSAVDLDACVREEVEDDPFDGGIPDHWKGF